MTKFAISEEGAQALEALGNSLRNNVNAISEVSENLVRKIEELNGSDNLLGVYYDKIESSVGKNLTAIFNNIENLSMLEEKAKVLAENIREMLGLESGVLQVSSNGSDSGNSDWKPRELEETEYGYEEASDGSLVYDSPEETYESLIQEQGLAYPNEFLGTCALCSCANILRLAGAEVSEQDVIDYAAAAGICETGYKDPYLNGGANVCDMQKILKHFGLESEIIELVWKDNCIDYDATIKMIADYVDHGRGVILVVNAHTFWYNWANDGNTPHAVTAISVKRDTEGNIFKFFICDTGTVKGKWWHAYKKVAKSLMGGHMVVTGVIR